VSPFPGWNGKFEYVVFSSRFCNMPPRFPTIGRRTTSFRTSLGNVDDAAFFRRASRSYSQPNTSLANRKGLVRTCHVVRSVEQAPDEGSEFLSLGVKQATSVLPEKRRSETLR
jgi:hypothetical protein